MSQEIPSFIPEKEIQKQQPEKDIERNPHTETPPLNERRAPEYQHYLGFDINELRGQKVLNIGAGRKGYFDKEAAKIADQFVSLSPHFGDKGLGGKLMKQEYRPSKIKRLYLTKIKKERLPIPIAALAEQLPFQDESFDRILSLYSVPLYTKEENFDKVFNEAIRVLKKGGSAHLYPLPGEAIPKIEKLLANENVTVDAKPLPELDSGVEIKDPHQLTITKTVS